MYVCMYVCMHACMHACMHVCMYVCMYVYIYSGIQVGYISIQVDRYSGIKIQVYRYKGKRFCMCVCANMFDKVCISIYMLSGPGPPPHPPPPPQWYPPPRYPPPPPHGPHPRQARAAARTCPCCRLGHSGICAAVVSRTRHELQLLNHEGCMAMVMVAAVL